MTLNRTSVRASIRGMAQQLPLRVPSDLHAVLKDRAGEQGVSLNHLCVALLAGGVGFKLKEQS